MPPVRVPPPIGPYRPGDPPPVRIPAPPPGRIPPPLPPKDRLRLRRDQGILRDLAGGVAAALGISLPGTQQGTLIVYELAAQAPQGGYIPVLMGTRTAGTTWRLTADPGVGYGYGGQVAAWDRAAGGKDPAVFGLPVAVVGSDGTQPRLIQPRILTQVLGPSWAQGLQARVPVRRDRGRLPPPPPPIRYVPIAPPGGAVVAPPAPAPAAQPAPGATQTGPGDLTTEQQVTELDLPGTARTVNLLKRCQAEPLKLQILTLAYRDCMEVYLQAKADQRLLSAADAAQVKSLSDTVAGIKAVGKVVSVVPIVGQVFSGITQLADIFLQGAGKAGINWFGNPQLDDPDPIFQNRNNPNDPPTLNTYFGWYRGCFYMYGVPILSWSSPRMAMLLTGRGNVASNRTLPGASNLFRAFDAVTRLAEAFPFGPSLIPYVWAEGGLDKEGETGGVYYYVFNYKNPGDLSSEARARGEVFTMGVENFADLTPTGPRQFDPQNPDSWRKPITQGGRPGQSRLDA